MRLNTRNQSVTIDFMSNCEQSITIRSKIRRKIAYDPHLSAVMPQIRINNYLPLCDTLPHHIFDAANGDCFLGAPTPHFKDDCPAEAVHFVFCFLLFFFLRTKKYPYCCSVAVTILLPLLLTFIFTLVFVFIRSCFANTFTTNPFHSIKLSIFPHACTPMEKKHWMANLIISCVYLKARMKKRNDSTITRNCGK